MKSWVTSLAMRTSHQDPASRTRAFTPCPPLQPWDFWSPQRDQHGDTGPGRGRLADTWPSFQSFLQLSCLSIPVPPPTADFSPCCGSLTPYWPPSPDSGLHLTSGLWASPGSGPCSVLVFPWLFWPGFGLQLHNPLPPMVHST